MPDIAMCHGDGCNVKETCYRHIVEPSLRQSYFVNPPYKEENGKQICEHYWKARYVKERKESSTTSRED